MRVAKQKQPMLRLFWSAKPLEHLVEQGLNKAAAKLDAKEKIPSGENEARPKFEPAHTQKDTAIGVFFN